MIIVRSKLAQGNLERQTKMKSLKGAVAAKNTDHIECLLNIKDNCSEKVNGECSKYYQRHHLPLCDKKNMIILIYFVYLD